MSNQIRLNVNFNKMSMTETKMNKQKKIKETRPRSKYTECPRKMCTMDNHRLLGSLLRLGAREL